MIYIENKYIYLLDYIVILYLIDYIVILYLIDYIVIFKFTLMLFNNLKL